MAITTNGGSPTANLTLSSELSAAITDESGTGAVVFNISPTFTTPTLGTASATAIELGHATDTTLARSSAGVITVEGVVVPTISSTSTLTNKTLSGAVLTSTLTANGTVGTSGYVISTTGTGVEWIAAPSGLPSQASNSGKYLTTDGSNASWATIATDPNPQVFMLMGA